MKYNNLKINKIDIITNERNVADNIKQKPSSERKEKKTQVTRFLEEQEETKFSGNAVTCSTTTFMSEKERKRRHKERIAQRRVARKNARGCESVQTQRQMYRDQKIIQSAGGAASTLSNIGYVVRRTNQLCQQFEELRETVQNNMDNAFKNLILSCVHVPNVKSNLWFLSVELVRFVMNLIPSSADAVKRLFQDLIGAIMGSLPQVREETEWPNRSRIILSASKTKSCPEEAAAKLSSVIGSTLVSKTVNLRQIKDLSQTFNSLCVTTKFMYSFATSFLTKHFRSIIQRLSSHFGLSDATTKVFKNSTKKFDTLADYVSEVDRIVMTNIEHHTSSEFLADVENIFAMTVALKQGIMSDVVVLDQHQKVLVQRAIDDISKWRAATYQSLRLPDAKKIVPFHLSFCGPPKQGKSVLTTFFAEAALKAPSTSWIFMNQDVYTRGQSKYWDRYKGQEVVIRDDLGTMRAPNDIEFDDRKFLMDVMTPTAFQVQMASIEDKGMTCACKLLVSSSNVNYFVESPAFTDINAVNRRRDMLVYTILDTRGPHKDAVVAKGLDPLLGNYRFLMLDPVIPDKRLTEADFKTKILNGTVPTINIIELSTMFAKQLSNHYNDHSISNMTHLTSEQLRTLFDIPTQLSTTPPPITFGSVSFSEATGSASIQSACVDCTDQDRVYGHVEAPDPLRYDVEKSYGGNGGPRYTWYEFQNVPIGITDDYLPDGASSDVCYKCYSYRYIQDGQLWLYTYPWDLLDQNDNVVERASAPHLCDCFIHEGTRPIWADYAEKELTAYDLRDSGTYQVRGNHYDLVINWDRCDRERDLDDVIQCASFDFAVPSFSGKDLLQLATSVMCKTLGYTKELFEYVAKQIPTWAWCVIIGLAAATSVGALMSLFNYSAKEEAPLVNIDMTEEEHKLFKSSQEDHKEAKVILDYVVQKANSSNWNLDRAVKEYYAASQNYDTESRTQARRAPPVLPRTYVRQVLSACLTNQGFDEVLPALKKNMRLVAIETDGKTSMQRCLFTHDRQFIVSAHFWRLLTEKSKVTIMTPNNAGDIGVYPFDANVMQSVFVDREDIAYVNVKSNVMNSAKDIRHLFGTSEDVVEGDMYSHVLWDDQFNTIISSNIGHLHGANMIMPDKSLFYIPKLIKVGVLGKLGDCGSVLIKNNKIVGMMSGIGVGETSCNFVPLTKDIPDLSNDLINDTRTIESASLVRSNEIASITPRGTIEHVGTVMPDYVNKIADRSKILKTVLNRPITDPEFQLYEVTKQPAVFTLGDKRVSQAVRDVGDSPMQIGLNKFAEPMRAPDPRHLEKAVRVVTMKLNQMKLTVLKKNLMNKDEVVNGVIDSSGTRIVEGMNMETSMGVPYRNYVPQIERKNAQGKYDYFERSNLADGDAAKYKLKSTQLGEKLRQGIAEMEKQLNENQVPLFVVAENLKDETLKISKIENAKTRVFETLPCDATMVYRKYFGAWTDCVRKNCVEFPISVGIAAQKRDWTTIAHRMQRLGNNIIAGDYVNWDGKTPADVMMAACDVINAWYNDQHQRKRSNLIYALVHQLMVAGQELMMRHGGMSSGSPITSEFNSLVNWLLLLCAIQENIEAQGMDCTTEDLLTEFDFLLYGDDHVISVGPKFLGVVTFVSIQRYMLDHGFGYTDSAKSTNSFDYQTLEEITFLKRSFVNEDGRYKAPLDINSIRMSVMWWMKRRGTDSLKILMDKKNSFESEIFMHGKVVYDNETRLWNETLMWIGTRYGISSAELPLIYNSYQEHQVAWLKNT